jgi:hypothetical protein
VGLGATIPTKKSPTDPTKTVPAFDRRDPGFIALLNHPQEQIRKAATARLVAKQTMEGKRAENLANLLLAPVGGCFPFDVVFSGASQTHRLSGGDGAEGNPQNFPTKSEIRSAIQAPKGFKIICADFEKIDTRILAFISGDPALKKEVLDKNIYCLFAARLFNRLIDKHADPDEYKLGKCSILGLGYQMGWKRHKDDVLAKANITISDEESKRDVKTYRATYKHVPGLWDLCEAIFPALQRNAEISFPGARFLKIQKEKIILPSGLAICLPGIKQVGEKWEYQAYSQGEWRSQGIYGGALTAMICQALTGEVCKEAMRRCADMGYRFAGQVHDEEAYLAEGLIKTAMEAPMSWWPDLPLKVEIHTADNWREAK